MPPEVTTGRDLVVVGGEVVVVVVAMDVGGAVAVVDPEDEAPDGVEVAVVGGSVVVVVEVEVVAAEFAA